MHGATIKIFDHISLSSS